MNLIPNIQKLIPSEPLFHNLNGCFDEAYFLKTAGSLTIDQKSSDVVIDEFEATATHMIWTMTAKPALLAGIKQLFTNKTNQRELIVLDGTAASLADALRELLPLFAIAVLPETEDLGEVADCLAEAMLYVTGHMSTLIYCIFLAPGASVIEIQPKGLDCTAFGQTWTRTMGLRYVPMRTGKCQLCHHADLACYLREGTEYETMSASDIAQAIDRLV
jgi:hypothetical protein